MEKEERINPHAYTQAWFFFYLHQNKFSLSDTDGVKKKKEIICFQVSLHFFFYIWIHRLILSSPFSLSFPRNVLLDNGVHGYHDHNNEDLHQTSCYHDNHDIQDHHHQGARHDAFGGPVATNHIGSGGTVPDGLGRFGARRCQRGAGHR